jgi:transcriptional regulator with XRE-family HTH domain
METMGDRIKRLREAQGFTQTQLGELCGVSKSAVSQWEDGSTTDIKIKPFLALCDALRTDPHYLAFGPQRGPDNDRRPPQGGPADTGATGRFRRLRAKQS